MTSTVDQGRLVDYLSEGYIKGLRSLKYLKPNQKYGFDQVRPLPKKPKAFKVERDKFLREVEFTEEVLYDFRAIITAPTEDHKIQVLELAWEQMRNSIAQAKLSQGIITNKYGYTENGFSQAGEDYNVFENVMMKVAERIEKEMSKMMI